MATPRHLGSVALTQIRRLEKMRGIGRNSMVGISGKNDDLIHVFSMHRMNKMEGTNCQWFVSIKLKTTQGCPTSCVKKLDWC